MDDETTTGRDDRPDGDASDGVATKLGGPVTSSGERQLDEARRRLRRWSSRRASRLVAFIVLAVASAVISAWLRADRVDVRTISGRSLDELRTGTYPLADDVGRRVLMDALLTVTTSGALLAGLFLTWAGRGSGKRDAAIDPGRPLPGRPLRILPRTRRQWWYLIGVSAIGVHLVAGLFEAWGLDRVTSRWTGGRFELDPVDDASLVLWLARVSNAEWLSLAAAVVIMVGFWTRRVPRRPGRATGFLSGLVLGAPREPLSEDDLHDRPPDWYSSDNSPPGNHGDRGSGARREADWRPDPDRIGISVSGGGIRSASFALGAMEQLEREGILRRARYVTSASGGSYATAALEQINRYGEREPDPSNGSSLAGPTERLRRRLNYLLTSVGVGAAGLARIFLGILLNLLIVYLLIFVVVRPVGWFIGTPFVQEELRSDEPFVTDVIGGSTDPDVAPDAQTFRTRCGLDTDPDEPPILRRVESPGTDRDVVAFAVDVPTQCVKIDHPATGDRFWTFEVETAVTGLIDVSADTIVMARQPVLRPVGAKLVDDRRVKGQEVDEVEVAEIDPVVVAPAQAVDQATPTGEQDGDEDVTDGADEDAADDSADVAVTDDMVTDDMVTNDMVTDDMVTVDGRVTVDLPRILTVSIDDLSVTGIQAVLDDDAPLSQFFGFTSPVVTSDDAAAEPDGDVDVEQASADLAVADDDLVDVTATSIVDLRGDIDLDLRHWVIPLVLLGVAILGWAAGGLAFVRRLAREMSTTPIGRIRRRSLRRLPGVIGVLAIGAGVVLLLVPWMVKALPESVSTGGAGDASAESPTLVSWLPTGLQSVVAWPVLGILTVFEYHRAVTAKLTPDPNKRNSAALFKKVAHVLSRVLIFVILVILLVTASVTMMTTAALNGPFQNNAWITREVFGWSPPWPSDLVMWTLVVLLLLLTRTMFSANAWSLGTFYRDRLSWAFTAERSRDASFDGRDEATPESSERAGYLCGTSAELVLCCAANVMGPDRAPAGRNAVSFSVSRSWIGGPEVGWMRTPEYLDQLDDVRRADLSVASMTAISGAAVASASGKSTPGPIGSVIALLNVRLGAWLPHPDVVAANRRLNEKRRDDSDDLALPPLLWRHTPGWPYFAREVLRFHRHESAYLYVTDGGHWENLGLVEAIRRGCNKIVAISAAGDGAFSHGTLAEAVEIARTDLDVEIRFDEKVTVAAVPGGRSVPSVPAKRRRRAAARRPGRDGRVPGTAFRGSSEPSAGARSVPPANTSVWRMRPRVGAADELLPSGREFLQQNADAPTVRRVSEYGYTLGHFTRHGGVDPAHAEGTILLIEATMVDGLPVDVHAYAESHPEFPDISTGDQFFNDRDFESYRQLGEHLTRTALASSAGAEFAVPPDEGDDGD